ncbi:MAG: SLC13 family permease, partial [Planctomycetaceae bacterium]
IERWGLHRRMALHVVRVIGTTPRLIVLGFMAATAFLSMWISNTACTLLMLPIGLALIASLEGLTEHRGQKPGVSEKPGFSTSSPLARFSMVLMLSIAYAASIGGLTTLVGTPTNIAFVRIWDEAYPRDRFPDAPPISVGGWMSAVVPLGVVLLLAAWGLLTWRLQRIPGTERLGRSFFTDRLRQLGRPRLGELLMLLVFTATAVLWITRTPLMLGPYELLPGWAAWTADALAEWNVTADLLHDSTVAMGMAILLFALPGGRDTEGRLMYLMDWKTAERLPWGILLLFGGGFAIAGAFTTTGLSEWLGGQFAAGLRDQPTWVLVAGTCLMLTFLSDLTSNGATVSAILPILVGATTAMDVDPRLILIPAAISASFGFMLPIATPPNAIVFGTGRIRMGDMARYGFALNLIAVALLTIGTFVLLVPQFGIDMDQRPAWTIEKE